MVCQSKLMCTLPFVLIINQDGRNIPTLPSDWLSCIAVSPLLIPSRMQSWMLHSIPFISESTSVWMNMTSQIDCLRRIWKLYTVWEGSVPQMELCVTLLNKSNSPLYSPFITAVTIRPRRYSTRLSTVVIIEYSGDDCIRLSSCPSTSLNTFCSWKHYRNLMISYFIVNSTHAPRSSGLRGYVMKLIISVTHSRLSYWVLTFLSNQLDNYSTVVHWLGCNNYQINP